MILINAKVRGGVLKYRITPYTLVSDYVINSEVDWNDLDYLKQFDTVLFYKVPISNQPLEVIHNLKVLGIRVIIDIDDYWMLNPTHSMFEATRYYKIPEMILGSIKMADVVVTTTNYFADIIRNYNKNVLVIPNSIVFKEEQFIPNHKESELFRIGYLGGSSHYNDIQLLSKLNCEQFVLCGFDLRGTQQSIWYKMEKFITNNYRNIDKEYLEYLMRFKEEDYNDNDKSYKRIWTKDIDNYAKGYDEFDVALAPLEDNLFNRCKSPLKFLEASAKKCLFIGSDIVYDESDLKVKYRTDWNKCIKKLKNNDNLRNELIIKNYELVFNKYNLDKVNNLRKELINDKKRYYKYYI